MIDFKIGDVVKLKSGGPTMVVGVRHKIALQITPNSVRCQWVDSNGQPRENVYDAQMLELI